MTRERQDRTNEYRSEGRKSLMGLMDRTASADQTGRTLDILVLSGGGDFGAFGAGILGGWSQVKGEGAMPISKCAGWPFPMIGDRPPKASS